MTDASHSRLDALNLGLPADTERVVRRWIDDPHYASERPALDALLAEVAGGSELARAELLDAFSQVLPIGTGGRRGRVGPGPNRMNSVVVRETAQGVVDALRAAGDTPQVAIVYDTRMHSRQFAYAVAEQCAAGGLTVILLDAPRPTPELSFLVRRMGCGAGVVVSASHNPPEDNGIKIYGPDGAQVLGARDRALMRAILAAGDGSSAPVGAARGSIHVIAPDQVLSEADAPYHDYVLAQGVVPGSLEAQQGAGRTCGVTVLEGSWHARLGATGGTSGLQGVPHQQPGSVAGPQIGEGVPGVLDEHPPLVLHGAAQPRGEVGVRLQRRHQGSGRFGPAEILPIELEGVPLLPPIEPSSRVVGSVQLEMLPIHRIDPVGAQLGVPGLGELAERTSRANISQELFDQAVGLFVEGETTSRCCPAATTEPSGRGGVHVL